MDNAAYLDYLQELDYSALASEPTYSVQNEVGGSEQVNKQAEPVARPTITKKPEPSQKEIQGQPSIHVQVQRQPQPQPQTQPQSQLQPQSQSQKEATIGPLKDGTDPDPKKATPGRARWARPQKHERSSYVKSMCQRAMEDLKLEVFKPDDFVGTEGNLPTKRKASEQEPQGHVKSDKAVLRPWMVSAGSAPNTSRVHALVNELDALVAQASRGAAGPSSSGAGPSSAGYSLSQQQQNARLASRTIEEHLVADVLRDEHPHSLSRLLLQRAVASQSVSSLAGSSSPSPLSSFRFDGAGASSSMAPSVSASSLALRSLGMDEMTLEDLAPANAGVVKYMSPEERALVILKRKIRNRQSAKRSRQRREQAMAELAETISSLKKRSEEILGMVQTVVEENQKLKEEVVRLNGLNHQNETHDKAEEQ